MTKFTLSLAFQIASVWLSCLSYCIIDNPSLSTFGDYDTYEGCHKAKVRTALGSIFDNSVEPNFKDMYEYLITHSTNIMDVVTH